MNADGMVNVQTRHNAEGKPLLLEINMRPSGGIGYTRYSGVNLPGLYAFHTLGLMDDDQVRQSAKTDFHLQSSALSPMSFSIRHH